MRACPVEVRSILAHHAIQLPFIENQQVIKTFAPPAAQEAFGHDIRPGRTIRSLQHFDIRVLCDAIKGGSKFRIVGAHDEFGLNWDTNAKSFLLQAGRARLSKLSGGWRRAKTRNGHAK